MDDWVSINVIDGSHDAVGQSSCLEVYGGWWRRTERANLEKKPSIRLSQEPCLGVKVKIEAAWRPGVEPGSGFPSNSVRNDCRGSA